MERNFFSKTGTIAFWIGDAMSSETSQQFVDPYSFSHIQHGLLFFGLFWLFRNRLSLHIRFLFASAIEVFWEILENTQFIIDRYRESTAALGYYGDSIFNSLGDLASCWIGFYLAYKFGLRLSVLLFLIIEIIMIIMIKDSLLLNIIMLLYPIDFIREWQLT
ncbi:MAG TPA: DUF2585 family protein [Oligoflexia bacterium]|nr:DUF2585 family protein [Oligoflexia bacterium]